MSSHNCPRVEKPKRTIFSNFIDKPTDYEQQPATKTGDFKSVSYNKFGYADEKSCTKIYDSEYINQKSLHLEDSCTQTSKTIVQLAELETGRLSPDSLSASPTRNNHTLEFENDTQTSSPNDRGTKSMYGKTKLRYASASTLHSKANVDEDKEKSLTEQFLNRSRTRAQTNVLYVNPTVQNSTKSNSMCVGRSQFLQQTSPLRKLVEATSLKSTSCLETLHKDDIDHSKESSCNLEKLNYPEENSNTIGQTNFSLTSSENTSERTNSSTNKLNKKSTFMCPTISSENKNNQHLIRNISELISSPRRGRSASPKSLIPIKKNIPYIDRSRTSMSCDTIKAVVRPTETVLVPELNIKKTFSEGLDDNMILHIDSSEEILSGPKQMKSNSMLTYADSILSTPLTRLKQKDWNVAIKGLAEIVEICRLADIEFIYPYMTFVHQRLIELLKSPRSHVCRTACQAAGHLFECVKDTRRPEFDDIVDILLYKTADSNKFIRQDANLALDCMVTHIPTWHAVRALTSKGPLHKNHLVRTATVRLLVCVIVIAGSESILHVNNTEHTRKIIIQLLPKFIEDKNVDVRKFGQRMYKILSKEPRFDFFLKKYLEPEDVIKLEKNISNVRKKV